MTNYHPEYKPGCKLANARIAELEAENEGLRSRRLPCAEAEVAQKRYEYVEAERDALRKALALLDDAFPNDVEHAMEQAGVTFTGLLDPRKAGEA